MAHKSTFTIPVAAKLLNRQHGTIYHWLHDRLKVSPVNPEGRIKRYDIAVLPQLTELNKSVRRIPFHRRHVSKSKTEVAPWIQRQPESPKFVLDAEPVAHDVEPVQQSLQLPEPVKDDAKDKLAEAIMSLAREVRQLTAAIKQRRY